MVIETLMSEIHVKMLNKIVFQNEIVGGGAIFLQEDIISYHMLLEYICIIK